MKGNGVAREKNKGKKLKKIVKKKFQPNRSIRLAGYTQHIYTNVLFYYIEHRYEC